MISHGYKTVTTAGTAVPLSATSQKISFITIYPRIVSGVSNTGQVRIGGLPLSGDSGAIPSGKGIPLNPGDAAVVWPLGATISTDLSTVYVDADNNGDGVQFVWGAL